MLAWLRWHLAKWRLASLAWKRPTGFVKSSRQWHRCRAEDFPPDTEGYLQLARVWDDYASWFVPGYAEFLASAMGHYGRSIRAVLDLACGTGLLTRRLAGLAES